MDRETADSGGGQGMPQLRLARRQTIREMAVESFTWVGVKEMMIS
jgi:hypothetical protein